MVSTTTFDSSKDGHDYYHNGTDLPRRQLLADKIDSPVEQPSQPLLEPPPTLTTTTSMPTTTAVNHFHLFVNLLTLASALAILVIVCHMYP